MKRIYEALVHLLVNVKNVKVSAGIERERQFVN